MDRKTLEHVVAAHPFPDYQEWWDVGEDFLGFMSEAIISTWGDRDLDVVHRYLEAYLQTVYSRGARENLLADFAAKQFTTPIRSGEFDSLSYAFYRSAFELTTDRRLFTQRVGERFYRQVHAHLNLGLPEGLRDENDFTRLKVSIGRLGEFLRTNGYLRDHFNFRFSLNEEQGGKRIIQEDSDVIDNLINDQKIYALYSMGYPIILPSAVYLYHTMGEAQHHSSRIIEALFERVGCAASETDDFDPTGYPADQVVELWEIRKLG